MLRKAVWLICFMWLTVACNCIAQSATTAPTFTPAENVLFIDDMMLYGHDFVQHKWRTAQGLMVVDFDSNGNQSLSRNLMYYHLAAGNQPMAPIIATPRYKAKYTTFECDFQLFSRNRKFIVNFPDERGYKHTIAIDDNWLYENWQGSRNNGTDIITPIIKDKRRDRFNANRWHCLAIAISEEYIDVFLDGRHIWSVSHDSSTNTTSAYLFDGFLPATFTISAEKHAGLRHVRFAQSDKIPPRPISTHIFDTLLTTATFTTHDIHFETGKAILKRDCYNYLSALATWLKENPAVKLEISGHTDSDGNDADNLKLSEARAQAVVSHITTTGIDKARLKYKGYGEAAPIMPNDTEAGKAANRRVELRKL